MKRNLQVLFVLSLFITESFAEEDLWENKAYAQNIMDINHQIANTQAIVTTSQRKLQSLNQALKARQLALETMEKSWKLNLVDVSEILKEQRSVHEIEINILTEERKQDMEKLRLHFLTGRLK